VLKILHTADWQIGKLYGQFEPDDAALLADARFAAVERLAQLASVQGVDLVLVAGDVFDAQGVAERTIHRLFHCLRGYAGPWIMIPGNHDAALSESVWTRAARLGAIPPNVTVCLAPGSLLFDSLRVAVLAAPLTQRLTHTDLTAGFAAADTPSGFHRIGVAHGSVQGILADGIDSSNPIAAGRAAEARLDYLALGDWHGCRQVDARTWYSGTPETDRFRANDSGRALIVEIGTGGAEPVVTPVITGQYRWLSESGDTAGAQRHRCPARPADHLRPVRCGATAGGRPDRSGRACAPARRHRAGAGPRTQPDRRHERAARRTDRRRHRRAGCRRLRR
jgi:DNA repair exonuclease SbcCD nuclease subunit